MHSSPARVRRLLLAAGLGSLGLLYAGVGSIAGAAQGPSGSGSDHDPSPSFHVTEVLSGSSLHHQFTPAGSSATQSEALSKPDDITRLGDELFVGFQNGVGPQGEPSADGNLDSTIVELTLTGRPISQWDVVGKADGVTAVPDSRMVIATVNEDFNSALYTIRPNDPSPADQAQRYSFNEALPHGGGTDAISVYHDQLLVSASAPGMSGAPAPQPTYPAVYSVDLDRTTHIAKVSPLFNDGDAATIANVGDPQFGKTTQLALTDPDSSEIVPFDAPRFAGDFMLTSQGDQQQIYVSGSGGPHQRLKALSLSQAVDDTAWPTDHEGRLFSTDSTHDAVDAVTGPFHGDQPLVVATPCGSNSAPSTCPAPPTFPTNYLATLDPWTGQVTAVTTSGAPYTPQGGLVFVPGSSD
jgi:hypothetical protein